MFDQARCPFDDFQRLCETSGLENALSAFREAGVYLTHNEFKGLQPIVRDGREIVSAPRHFLNPLADSGRWQSVSGGSRSAGSVAATGSACRVYRECGELLAMQAMDVMDRPMVLLAPILPAPYGFTRCVTAKQAGAPCLAWFSEGRPAFVPAVVTPAIRVVDAAIQHTLDLSGTVFWAGGEAITDARRAALERANCRVYPNYFISEVGLVGSDCCSTPGGNSVHLFSDNAAIITWKRPAPLSERPVESLLFTTLHPLNPRLLINAEMDDSGTLAPAACDCALSRAGFRTRVSNIYSFGKLTGHGTTLVGGDILRILEVVLPAKFGGTPADYQLVEEDSGITLHVHPRLTQVSLDAVKQTFLQEIERLFGGSLTVREWRHAGTLRVVAALPIRTRAGKTLPLHLLERWSSH